MDLKNLNPRQKQALIVGSVVALGAVGYGLYKLNTGTPSAPKFKIVGVDANRHIHIVVNGQSHKIAPTGFTSFPLSDKFRIMASGEWQEDGTILRRFFHTGADPLNIISELGQVYV